MKPENTNAPPSDHFSADNPEEADTPAEKAPTPAGGSPSPKQLAAVRQNAKKSTGPRTEMGKRLASGNSLKTGLYAQPHRRNMLALGEDPQAYERLHQGLREAYPPTDMVQEMLLEDIAQLWWKRIRGARAQAALQQRQVELLELERLRQNQKINHDPLLPASEAELARTGLRLATPRPARFKEMLSYLALLISRVECHDFSEDLKDIFEALYGKAPTRRGALITGSFRSLAHPELCSAPPDENLHAQLHRWLLEERREVGEAYELFRREHMEITRAQQEAALVPTQALPWALSIRQENSIDRQIERKLKLLLKLQGRETAPNSRLGRDGSPGKADPPSEKGGRSPRRQGSLPGLDTAAQPERLTGEQE